MTPPNRADPRLTRLTTLTQEGKLAQAAQEGERLLAKHPQDVRIHLAHADILRAQQRWSDAARAYTCAAELGLPQANVAWRFAGLAYQTALQPVDALHAYHRALRLDSEDWDVMANLLPLHAQLHAARPEYVLPLALRLIESQHSDLRQYFRAAQVLKNNKRYGLALQAYEKSFGLSAQGPTDPGVLAGMLEAAQYACLWDKLEQQTQQLSAQLYASGQGGQQPYEKILMHIAWCMNEVWNRQVLNACLLDKLSETTLRSQPFDHSQHRWPELGKDRRLRIGYVSWDFFDHATLHLIGGVLDQHDKTCVEIFAYDYSPKDASRFRKRFEASVEHIVDIGNMTDIQAAERIYADQIDILVDLKGPTAHTRPSIFAMRPAPVQVTWLGFPGSSGLEQMDYILGDATVLPDSSQSHYPEKFCRLPDTYQPNDYERPIGDAGGSRSDWGLPESGTVFCSFNQSYKIDRITFDTWLQVLAAVPGSVLWLLDPGLEAQDNLRLAAQAKGIDPHRLVYTPKVPTPLHMARLPLADLCLDTRVYNGHTTTSDALWMGVPVVTAPGTHFASRVSASLLRAVDMPELIAPDMQSMAHLAIELGNNPERLAQVRAKLQKKRFIAPLYDTERFTRHLERAFERMAERARQGLPAALIDVEPLAPRQSPFTSGVNISVTGIKVPPHSDREDYLQQLAQQNHQVRLQWPQTQCPLCRNTQLTQAGEVPWSHSLAGITHGHWAQCDACKHVFTRYYWSDEGLALLQSELPGQTLTPADVAASSGLRRHSGNVVRAAVTALGGQAALSRLKERAKWMDVGSQDPWLVSAAQEWGFNHIAAQRDAAGAQAIRSLGLQAVHTDFLRANIEGQFEVISFMGSLEQEAFPDLLLSRAAQVLTDGGVVVIGFDNAASTQWRMAERNRDPAIYNDPRRLHWFGTSTLVQLLQARGFNVQEMLADDRSAYGMVLIAKKEGK